MFRGRGLVELIMLPLSYADGSISVSVFGTAQRTGFTDAERSLMKRILPALRTATRARNKLTADIEAIILGALSAGRCAAGHRAGWVVPT